MMRYFAALVLAASSVLAQEPTAPTPTPAPTPAPAATPKPTPTPVPPPLSTRELINGLKDDELDKAIETLRQGFLDPTLTDDKAAKRATLEGLVRRLAPGAAVINDSDAQKSEEDTTFVAEILDSRIGYLRLGKLDKDNLAQMDAALANFAAKKVEGVVVDVRGVPQTGDFEMAAEFARRFCPKGKLLFSLQKPSAKQERIFTSNQDPSYQGVLVVLTDGDTSGAPEVLAATLRLNSGALIVGSDTAGEALEFEEAQLGGGAKLRYAVAQVILPQGDPIYPGGVKPDIAIALSPTTQKEIFAQSKEKGVSQFVFDAERQRMSEAALVANLNPEIDGIQSLQRDKGKATALRDTVLQRAVDLITAINFYKDRK